MSEQEIPENYPRCRFCGEPMGDGGLILEGKVCSSSGLLTLCDACNRLITAFIEDSLPQLLRNALNKIDDATHEELSLFDFHNWEKYVKKKPE